MNQLKTTINAEELRELGACEEGLETFLKAHGEKTVKLSEAFDSNGWDDIWWLISKTDGNLSKDQQDDLHLIGCDWAESALTNFEAEFPHDDRPRKAIEAKRAFVRGEVGVETLSAARSAAESAAWSAAEAAAEAAAESAAWSAAESAAESAARSAAESAWSAAWSARSAAESARSAARSAARSKMQGELMQLFKKWESVQYNINEKA